MKKLLVALLCLSSVYCLAGEIAEYHLQHPHPETGRTETFSTNHGITEIGIERTQCFGTCPAYTFIVKSDGTFRYKGTEYVERKGEFTGTIWVGGFNRLAQFIKDSDYMNLPDNYRAGVTDNPTVYTLVVANGKKKTISNYANSGPTKLWAIEQLIDSLLVNAKWDEPKKATPKKN